MARVAPVRLRYNPKAYWFDPGDLEIKDGERVIVETERGSEYGVCDAAIEVGDDELAQLKSPLRPVLRIATEDDLDQAARMLEAGKKALPVFREIAAESNDKMHPVMVEYLFGGDAAVFYFEAEERIDFRDIVRKLASRLNVRVDMRQVGVRDKARMVGGLGHCGQELCCRRLGGNFNPVSIRMAKDQDLSLNPQKISGLCGRLMCCLRYESEAYKEFKARAPKQNARIETPDGTAKVVALDMLHEEVTVLPEGENAKRVTFPLSAMDEPPEGEKRPKSIGEAYREYADADPMAAIVASGLFDTAGFTQEDKLAKPEAHHNPRSRKAKDAAEAGGEGTRKSRHRRSRGGRGKGGASSSQGASSQGGNAQGRQHAKGERAQGAGHGQKKRTGQRPGQKSSALRRQGEGASGSSASSGRAASQGDAHRKARRRSHRSGGTAGADGGSASSAGGSEARDASKDA